MLQQALTKDDRARRWEDYIVLQNWSAFTDDDHAVWDLLFARQVELLGTRVVSAFLDGIDLLKLSHPGCARRRRAERHIGAAYRLANGRSAGTGS